MLAQLLLPLLFSAAWAHFTLDYPMSRGFDEDTEPYFCGGFTTPEARQPFPLTDAPIHITSHHTLASVVAFISTSTNPTSFSDFNATSNGTAIPLLTNFFQVQEGSYCWNANFANLGLGLTNGSLITLQVQFNGGDGDLYQCSDLVLLSNYTVPSNETCANDATKTTVATSSMSSSMSASSTSASSAAATSKSAAGRETAFGWVIAGIAGLVGVSFS